jgi:hypothetical protein
MAVLIVVAAGCGDDGIEASGPEPASTTAPVATGTVVDVPATQVVIDYEPDPPVDALLYGAQGVVRATVEAVRGPFWNQASGEAWRATADDVTEPGTYREVDVRPAEVLRDDGLDLHAGDVLTVLAPDGDAGGSFQVGEEVVLLVNRAAFLMREGPIDAVQPVGGSNGVWHVTDAVTLVRQGRTDIGREELPLEEFLAMLAVSRAEEHPEWDDIRYPPTAADVAEMMARDDIEAGSGE